MKNQSFKIITTGEIEIYHTSYDETKFYPYKDKIEKIWKKTCQQKDIEFYNDKVLVFNNFSKNNHKTVINGSFIDYKFIIADRNDSSLKFSIYQIGVSGMIIIKEKNEKYVLFSTRSSKINEYPGYLELVPSGNMDKSCKRNDGTVDFKSKLINEFEEETGLSSTNINEIKTLCLVMDSINRVYDVCCWIDVNMSRNNVLAGFKKVSEYENPKLVKFNELSNFVEANRQKIIPTSLAIIQCYNDSY